jgi:hypothetical protein
MNNNIMAVERRSRRDKTHMSVWVRTIAEEYLTQGGVKGQVK